MPAEKSRQPNRFFEIALFAILSLLCSMAGMLCGVSGTDCLKFALYQTGVIFLPGSAICDLLAKSTERDWISRTCLSYALGYALSVL